MSESKNGLRHLVGSGRMDTRPWPPFSDEAVAFLADVSAKLMADPSVRSNPDVVSFAYWCRKGHLARLKEAMAAENAHRLGRGLAFHVAPSNVPVNFAFSFAFGLLAGNANIVRVPSKPYPQVTLICSAVSAVLEEHPRMEGRVTFVSYPADNAVTSEFSRMADARILWGGDETVASLRALPCKPRCVDVVFPNRYSISVLDAQAVGACDAAALQKLAERFYNDTYLMDQNACSSARLVLWLQEADRAVAGRFWQALRECASRAYGLQGAVAVDKYVQLCEDAIEGRACEKMTFDPLLSVVRLSCLPEDLGSLHGKGGYFYECAIDSFEDVVDMLDERCQTVTCFGVDAEKLRGTVLSHGARGVDRVVGVGSAMDIDIVWDGYDLVGTLSRTVDAR